MTPPPQTSRCDCCYIPIPPVNSPNYNSDYRISDNQRLCEGCFFYMMERAEEDEEEEGETDEETEDDQEE